MHKKCLICISIIAALALLVSCSDDNDSSTYRQDMRSFVKGLSSWARTIDTNFIVIPQNGQELLTRDGSAGGTAAGDYIAAVNGVGREDLFYGYTADNVATPASESDYMAGFLDVAKSNGLTVLVTDYCSGAANMDDSYSKNAAKGYISLAVSSRELDSIPSYPVSPNNANTNTIAKLSDVKNFLYLINPDNAFSDKADYINALIQTGYDMFIIDAFYDGRLLTSNDIDALRYHGMRTRMVIAYMSIGEAENYRYYWDSTWTKTPPSWLAGENADWPGNYKVRYWESGWQSIIYGNSTSYLKKILDAGFDGVYLDIIDAFEYFE